MVRRRSVSSTQSFLRNPNKRVCRESRRSPVGANPTRPIGRSAGSNQSSGEFEESVIYPYVELNRFSVGAGEWIGVGPRFVSCECGGLPGPVALIEAKIPICAGPVCEPCFCDAILRLERRPHDSLTTTLYRRPATQELLRPHDQSLRPRGRKVRAISGTFARRVNSGRCAVVSDSRTGP